LIKDRPRAAPHFKKSSAARRKEENCRALEAAGRKLQAAGFGFVSGVKSTRRAETF
jgi:hypothetical protein